MEKALVAALIMLTISMGFQLYTIVVNWSNDDISAVLGLGFSIIVWLIIMGASIHYMTSIMPLLLGR